MHMTAFAWCKHKDSILNKKKMHAPPANGWGYRPQFTAGHHQHSVGHVHAWRSIQPHAGACTCTCKQPGGTSEVQSTDASMARRVSRAQRPAARAALPGPFRPIRPLAATFDVRRALFQSFLALNFLSIPTRERWLKTSYTHDAKVHDAGNASTQRCCC